MVVEWYKLIAGWIVTLIGMVATGLWLQADPGPEPRAAFVGTIAAFVIATIAIPTQFFFGERFVQIRAARRQEKRHVLDWALGRLNGEMKNFRRIQQKNGYSGEPHRKAVEEASFELLGDEIAKLAAYHRYKGVATRILAEIDRNRSLPPEHKDVSRLIPMLERLGPKLGRDLKNLNGSAEL